MKRLLIDTGVLLDLTILELAEPRFHLAWRRMEALLHQAFKGRKLRDRRRQRDRLIDFVRREFGAVEVSTGALIELDQLALPRLTTGNREDADLSALEEFWIAQGLVRERFAPSKFQTVPLGWDTQLADDRLQLGPVDAEALRLLADEPQRWLVTIDEALMKRALTRHAERVLVLEGVLEARGD